MSKRILIVDDEKEIADLLEDFLTVEGFDVSKAFNAKEAREHLQREEIFLVLLDIMMPDDSGFTLCKEIRRTSSIPILFLSALDDDTSKIRGLSIGADDYIVKNASPLGAMAGKKVDTKWLQMILALLITATTIKIWWDIL